MKRIGRDTYIDGSLEIEGRLTSRLPDGGLSPLQVLSKVLNLNVNVEFLGGYRAVEFPRKAENANITDTVPGCLAAGTMPRPSVQIGTPGVHHAE